MTDKQFEELKSEIQLLRDDVQPVIDIVNTLKRLGIWAVATVGFVGALIGVAIGIKDLFKK